MPIRLAIKSTGEGDLSQMTDGSLVDDDGLETMITVSLFTDALATVEEAGLGKDRRGYWFDRFDEDDPTLNIGSKLWLLEGRVIDQQALKDATTWANEAVAWMVTARIALSVTNVITRLGDNAIQGVTSVVRPTDPTSPYQSTWERHFAV